MGTHGRAIRRGFLVGHMIQRGTGEAGLSLLGKCQSLEAASRAPRSSLLCFLPGNFHQGHSSRRGMAT